MSPNRRSVLATGVSALPLGLAGCLGNNPDDEEPTGGIELTTQLPSPDVLGENRYSFEYFDIATIGEDRPDLVDPLGGVMELRNLFGMFYLAGLIFEDIDFLTRGVGDQFNVAHGDFDVDALASELEASGFTQAGNGDDPTVYGIEGIQGNPAAIGVSDSRVVTAGSGAINEEEDLAVGELARDPVGIVSDIFAQDTATNDRYTSVVPAIASIVAHIEGERSVAGKNDDTTTRRSTAARSSNKSPTVSRGALTTTVSTSRKSSSLTPRSPHPRTTSMPGSTTRSISIPGEPRWRRRAGTT